MKIVCKCLNIKIEVENFVGLEVVDPKLSLEEKCHPYFQENVYQMPGNVSSVTEVFPKHVKSEIIGSWNICKCLICKFFTHGTNYVTGLATCSSHLKGEPVDLKSYGQRENISYSQVFHICFPSRLDIPENYSSDAVFSELFENEFLEDISKKANSFLEMAEKKIKYSNTPVEKQEQTMKALRRRVKCEERYLHMVMLNDDLAQDTVSPTGCPPLLLHTSGFEYEDSLAYMVSDVTRPAHYYTSPSLGSAVNVPPLTNEIIPQKPAATNNFRIGMTNFTTDCDKLESDFSNLHVSSSLEKKVKPESHLDMTEGVFEMDDFISPNAAAKYISEEEKESDDEVFPEFSEEELNSRRGISARDLAKSVPLDVPNWPCTIDRHDRGVDTKRPKDPQEIAASMRELARSVRTSSVDVFGELPRPNFASTAEFLP